MEQQLGECSGVFTLKIQFPQDLCDQMVLFPVELVHTLRQQEGRDGMKVQIQTFVTRVIVESVGRKRRGCALHAVMKNPMRKRSFSVILKKGDYAFLSI